MFCSTNLACRPCVGQDSAPPLQGFRPLPTLKRKYRKIPGLQLTMGCIPTGA
ncbi:hypothetical protein BD414DRAFT_475177 [Trametes punicea]|nr:hypothetical protein BD414DRAFT_475177 [Trametes punicea]